MSHIPVFEEILLHIHQGLGLERPESKHVRQFTTLEFSLKNHDERAAALLDAIFEALEMDHKARSDASINIDEWFGFERELAVHVWTHEASQAQVLWHLLAYSWIPGLARRLAFWSMAGGERGVPFDAGMPGGRFWFLPETDPASGALRLPVPQVVDWLVDLLGEQSLEKGFEGLARTHATRANEHALRTLQGWRSEVLPKSAAMIGEMFHDGARLDYLGAFTPAADGALDDQAAAARAFIRSKKLQPNALARDIPVTEQAIAMFMNGDADPALAEAMVGALATRYAVPSMKMVRQRLRVARLMQDGFQRLLKVLAGATPGSEQGAHALMLSGLALFHTIYNRTVESGRHGTTAQQQDHWFESGFPQWDRDDLLLSIMPSQRATAAAALGERLSRKFASLPSDAPLHALVPAGTPEQAAAITAQRQHRLETERQEDERLRQLSSTIPAALPWPALQAESGFSVVSRLSGVVDPATPMHEAVIQRMHALATTPSEQAQVRISELRGLLLCRAGARPADAQARVGALLQELEQCPGYGVWKAPLLWLRARHRLNQNDIDGAIGDYRATMEACLERSHGALRFLAAHEGLALDVASKGLVPRIQEVYFRHLRQSPSSAMPPRSLEDAATGAEELFWDRLYQPYRGIERVQGQMTDEVKHRIGQSIDLMHKGDLPGLRKWLEKFARSFRSVKMRDARRDSVLLLWIKQMSLLKQMPLAPKFAHAPANPLDAMHTKIRQAIAVLLEVWPEHAKIADFKGQTPLMLAADNGDIALTRMLAPHSDVDAQDFIGRTALHAAVSGGVPDCVATVLDLGPDVLLVTEDEGQTALHTAVRFGQPKVVSTVADAFPGLTGICNLAGLTPLAMAHKLEQDHAGWEAHMRRQNRRIGSQADFEAVAALLHAVTPDATHEDARE